MIIAWLMLWAAAAPEPGPPTAMALTVPAGASLQRAGMEARPLRAMDVLRKDDVIQVGAHPVALVILGDGHGELVAAQARVTLGEEGCVPARLVTRQASRMSEAQLRSLRGLAGGSRSGVGVLRAGGPTPPPRVQPIDGATVTSDRPRLRWTEAPGARGYRVRMLRGAGRDEVVLWQRDSAAAHLDYPADAEPLTRGTLRRWRVSVLGAEGVETPFVESRIALATAEECQELDALQPWMRGEDPAGWILAAAALESHGVLDAALRLYEQLAERFPEEPAFPRALASYYERAGLPDQARQMRDRVERLEAPARQP